jgi:hypothetical protein
VVGFPTDRAPCAAELLGGGWWMIRPLVRLSEGALSLSVMCLSFHKVRGRFWRLPSLACGVADAESVPLER